MWGLDFGFALDRPRFKVSHKENSLFDLGDNSVSLSQRTSKNCCEDKMCRYSHISCLDSLQKKQNTIIIVFNIIFIYLFLHGLSYLYPHNDLQRLSCPHVSNSRLSKKLLWLSEEIKLGYFWPKSSALLVQ